MKKRLAVLLPVVFIAVFSPARGGSFQLPVSATYPASLYYLIDQMADPGPHASHYYLKFWKKEFGLTNDEKRMLLSYDSIRRRYSLDVQAGHQSDEAPFFSSGSAFHLREKWPLPFCTSDTLGEAWSKTEFIFSDEDAAELRRIFAHFDIKFRPRWKKDSKLLKETLAEFHSNGWETKMSEHLERVARFFGLDPTKTRRYGIFFVWTPGRQYSGGTSHARLIGNYAQVERVPEEGPADKLPIVVHEIVHGLFHSMDADLLSRFQTELLAPDFDAGLAAYQGLNEAFAASLGNGLFMETYLPALAKGKKTWYAESDVDSYAHAIDPLNREFMARNKTVKDGYAPKLLRALRPVAAGRSLPLSSYFETFILLSDPTLAGIHDPLMNVFAPHSVWSYSADSPRARKLLEIHWATPAVIVVPPSALDNGSLVVPGLELIPAQVSKLVAQARRGPAAYMARSRRGRPYIVLIGDLDGLRAGMRRLSKLPLADGSMISLR